MIAGRGDAESFPFGLLDVVVGGRRGDREGPGGAGLAQHPLEDGGVVLGGHQLVEVRGVGDAPGRASPRVADRGVEVDRVGGLRQILGLQGEDPHAAAEVGLAHRRRVVAVSR